ncbi:hypothetical protein HCN44_005560 [Aphidius gifuensis]|uniref:Lebercilin domain-containing protein n=1 Tax=Aphidius gifuensis TaxID=684658 RepID=A0A834Y527_APHGI|nr:protein PFC0760c [Aphidius gifuensis]KAF7997283.1 hypothetical protein HCN44_005560 [Aphidius gifuensis]
MQTDVTKLPVVNCDSKKNNKNREIFETPIEISNHTKCKGTLLLQSNQKKLNPLLAGGPYKTSMKSANHLIGDSKKSTTKNPVGQRIISAKSLRVKELQNQLADAHYHLNELASENRLLRSIQKRQDSALKKYEGTNAELPRIINSHHEELKVLQIKYKSLRLQYKQTCDLLKEKENEIRSLQSQNRHLLQLSKDRHLGEREQLKMQVSDLNLRLEKQQEKIQMLNKKLTLETKSLKHQLNSEIAKHKITEKQLFDSLEKLTAMEYLMDNREKRLYHNNGQIPTGINKKKSMTSQSLTNLQTTIKSSTKNRDTIKNDFKNQSLPKLMINESNDLKLSNKKSELPIKNEIEKPKTETMTSFQQVRKFKLQRSPLSRHSSARAMLTDYDNKSSRIQYNKNFNNSTPDDINRLNDYQDGADEEIQNIMKNYNSSQFDDKRIHQISDDDLLKQYNYSSSEDDVEEDANDDDDDDDNDDDNDDPVDPVEKHEIAMSTSKSRQLHARLINGSIESLSQQVSFNHEKISNNYHRKITRIKNNTSPLTNDTENRDNIDDILLKNKLTDNIDDKKYPLNYEHESSRERLLNLTKSWTEMKENIKREREISEKQLQLLDNHDDHDDNSNDKDDQKLLRYFERDIDNDDVMYEIHPAVKNSDDKLKNNKVLRDDNDDNLSIDSSSKEGNTPETVIENKSAIKTDDNHDNSIINFDKKKLLDAMKAIDNNENVELINNQKIRNDNITTRSQVTENLYRGLPTHVRKRDDIIKDIFGETNKIDNNHNKIRNRCSKLH